MATIKGILGQSTPSATSLTDIYTVPGGKDATVKVIITNRSSAAATFRVSVAVNGAADSNEQYIAYDKGIAGSETGVTASFMIGSLDVVRVYSTSSDLSFTCTGIEKDE